MKTGIIIQARMGSSRLPGKVMKDLFGKPVLRHVIDRLKICSEADEIIVATTTDRKDDIIAEEARRNDVRVFRGSEDDVLSRYYLAAKENDLDVITRITSDCPLIDPFITRDMIRFFKTNRYELVTNAGSDPELRTYPRGLDTEVFTFMNMEQAFHNAKEKYQREHVTPYIYENSSNIFYYKNSVDYSRYRWTLDTQEDFEMIESIYRHLYKDADSRFYFKDILRLLEDFPEISRINEHVEQKKTKDQ